MTMHLARTSLFAAALTLAAACADHGDRRARHLTPTEPSFNVTIGNNWVITVDGHTPPTDTVYLNPTRSLDTAWVTVFDDAFAARYDVDNFQWTTNCGPGVNCSAFPTRDKGFPKKQYGYVVGPSQNSEGGLGFALQRADFSFSTKSIIYRQLGVFTHHAPAAAGGNYTLSPVQQLQLVDTALAKWNNQNVNQYFPASWSTADASIAIVNSTGTVTAVNCGTVNITSTRGGVAASRAITVTPCKLVISISGPTLVQPNMTCTYTATVTAHGSGTYPTIHWYGDDAGMGDGSLTMPIQTNWLDGDGALDVFIIDSNGISGSSGLHVTVSTSAPSDPRCS